MDGMRVAPTRGHRLSRRTGSTRLLLVARTTSPTSRRLAFTEPPTSGPCPYEFVPGSFSSLESPATATCRRRRADRAAVSNPSAVLSSRPDDRRNSLITQRLCLILVIESKTVQPGCRASGQIQTSTNTKTNDRQQNFHCSASHGEHVNRRGGLCAWRWRLEWSIDYAQLCRTRLGQSSSLRPPSVPAPTASQPVPAMRGSTAPACISRSTITADCGIAPKSFSMGTSAMARMHFKRRADRTF